MWNNFQILDDRQHGTVIPERRGTNKVSPVMAATYWLKSAAAWRGNPASADAAESKETMWMFRDAKTCRACGTGYWRKSHTGEKGTGREGGGEGALEICRAVPLSLWWRTDWCMCKGELPGTKERTTEKE